MSVFLVGAGPWAPGLLTLRGAELLGRADVVFYDHLANPALLDAHCRPEAECERVFVGKRANRAVMPQEAIAEQMIEAARAGRTVVRLKGGDPFLFGRGGEEGQALAEAGVAFEIVPGVTSALAAPAFAGIPLTDRRSASSVAIVTGHERQGGGPERVDLAALAAAADTVVFLMGVLRLRDNLAAMTGAGGLDPDTPAAAIRWATRADQQTLTGTVTTLPDLAEAAGLRPPAIVVVGEVVRHRGELAWFEARPLFGRTVAVTRPDGPGAARLVSLLTEQGALAVHTPAITLTAAPDPTPLTDDLPGVDWLILTSPSAAGFFADALQAANLDARALAGARLACVGPTTADAAWSHLRIRADLVPDGDYNAGALAKALIAEGVTGQRVLHPRSAAAPPDLADALTAAGADVRAPVAYAPVATADMALPDPLDAITFASGSAVDALVAAAGPRALRGPAVAAIGPVTAQAVARHGLDADVVPERSTAAGLVQALVDHFS